MFVKRISLIVLTSFATIFIYMSTIVNSANAFPDGINGYTGSPSTGGYNCSTCHFVVSTEKNALFTLTSDIPAEGYLPNVKYNFTLSILSKRTRAGFNVRLEDT